MSTPPLYARRGSPTYEPYEPADRELRCVCVSVWVCVCVCVCAHIVFCIDIVIPIPFSLGVSPVLVLAVQRWERSSSSQSLEEGWLNLSCQTRNSRNNHQRNHLEDHSPTPPPPHHSPHTTTHTITHANTYWDKVLDDIHVWQWVHLQRLVEVGINAARSTDSQRWLS